MHMRREKRARR